MPVGGPGRVSHDELRIDQGAHLHLGIEASTDARDHHVVDWDVPRGGRVEQAGQSLPGQGWAHADVMGGDLGTAHPPLPGLEEALGAISGHQVEGGHNGVHLQGHRSKDDHVAAGGSVPEVGCHGHSVPRFAPIG